MTADSPTSTPGKPVQTPFSRFKLAALNAAFSLILRSPFHRRLSERFILLSVKGRKTGKRYTFPVGYMREGDTLEVISPAGWWKNLRAGNTSVTVLLKGQKRRGIAEAFHGDDTVAEGYLRFMRRSPQLINMYKIELDSNGQPARESVRKATRNASFVRIQLTSNA